MYCVKLLNGLRILSDEFVESDYYYLLYAYVRFNKHLFSNTFAICKHTSGGTIMVFFASGAIGQYFIISKITF